MPTPGQLFAALWKRVEPHQGAILAAPWRGRAAPEFPDLVSRLEAADEVDVPSEITAYLEMGEISFISDIASPDERAFILMCALDDAAQRIHPALPQRFAGVARPIGAMLNAMRAERTQSGTYADVEGSGMVVPKGTLTSAVRPDDIEASGTNMARHFEWLTLVEPLGQSRRLRILAPSPSKFLLPPERRDQVGLAPIAEDPEDLRFEVSVRGDRAYLDTLEGSAELTPRIHAVVTSLLDDGAGIIVLPELVSSASAARSLSELLHSRKGLGTPALIVAGSGPSEDSDPDVGRPYNEASLLTSDGRLIARQRKLHLFNMGVERMKQCGIDRAKGHSQKNHMEDAAPGNELVICDLDGLGRTMVLICEDFEQTVPGGDIAEALRPDWILSPVLDISQKIGRWTHARAIEVARKTSSRIVISCSTTLGVRHAGKTLLSQVGTPPVYSGLCLDGSADLKFLTVSAAATTSPQRMLVSWQPENWTKHKTSAADQM